MKISNNLFGSRVYLLANFDAGSAFDWPLKDMAILKYGCTRNDVKARIRSANSKYKTRFELIAAIPVEPAKIFRIESSIKARYLDIFGDRREFLLLGHEQLKEAITVFMEEVCAAG